MSIIPAPPGFAVGIETPSTKRFAPPSPAANFLIGFFDRGDVAQINSPSGLQRFFGPATNYSIGYHDLLCQLAEGSRTTTIARIVGPAAVAALKVLKDATAPTPVDSIKVTANSVGQWGNNLAVQVALADDDDPEDERVRLVITEDQGAGPAVVDASPAAATVQDLVSWTSEVVTITALGVNLPAVAAAVALATGDDDRDGVTADSHVAALAKLDRRYGPGVLRAPGIDDEDVHLACIDHCHANNRLAFLDLADDATEADALIAQASLEASRPITSWRASLWNAWTYAAPITGQPDRLVPWTAIQAGIASRVLRTLGIGQPSFGPRRGASKIARRLLREWTTGSEPPGEVQRMYAGNVNTAIDRGQTIHSEGYRTLQSDYRREDLHVAFILMYLAWQGEELALSYLGEPIDRETIAAFHSDLTALCKRLVRVRAINPSENDPGFLIDTEGVNNEDTMAARELHGAIDFRPTGSVHWTDITVGTVAANERLPTAV